MKDGILKETKNSRLLKADLPATYAELVALAAGAGVPADVLFNAEGWQQLPTFLNKKNLLQDSTAEVLGLTGDPTVDEAFLALLLAVKQAALVRVSVVVAGASAVAGIEVTGLTGLDGGAVYTDSAGTVAAFAPPGEVRLSTPEYQDLLSAATVTKTVEAGEIVDVTLTIDEAPKAGDKTLTTSTSGIRFSPYVTGVDVCCIGGGAGGSCGADNGDEDYSSTVGGAGGGQGSIINNLNLLPDITQTYTATVGAAGTGAKCASYRQTEAAQPGGTSSFMGVTASGGRVDGGGSGASYDDWGYSRGAATPGAANTTHIFNDESIPLTGGAGGGSGAYYGDPYNSGAAGGSPGGGRGGDHGGSSVRGGNGTSYGSGGGGGFPQYAEQQIGGNGYQGLVRYRWRVA